MHEKAISRIYLKELAGSFSIYGILLVLSITFGRPMAEGPARTLVLFSPMIGFGLAIWVIARQLGRIDEYQRMLQLESLAMAAAITAGLTFSYGFMETAGYPRLSMFTVWMVMGASWALTLLVRCRMNRE